MDKKLILFDIDGVLIKEEALLDRFSVAVREVFNIDVDIDDVKRIKTGGKTDTAILLELSELVGISRTEAKKRLNELYNAEMDHVKKQIDKTLIYPQKGVENLLKELKNRGYILDLVTGNLEKLAQMKLEKINLFHLFDTGAFGEVSDIRSKLIEEVIERTNSKFKIKTDKKNVFYFGDSPLDIKAGKEAGIRTIAVATGNYSKEDLEKENPDFILKDLSDLNQILNIIE